jgi:hypothetical protein
MSLKSAPSQRTPMTIGRKLFDRKADIEDSVGLGQWRL